MKIDFVLTAGNLNGHYLKLFPLISKVWKNRFNLDIYCILIADHIPEYLNDFKQFIILFKPIQNINDIYIAQVIRILYPALFENKNILITDLDIIPVSKSYFIDSIKDFNNNTFISYTDRYIKQNMIAICYNVANSSIYKKIFNIESIDDIKNKILEWYPSEYTGKKNCIGWYHDQQKLFEYLKKYNGSKIFLKDNNLKFNRLNNRRMDKVYIVENFKEILENLENYSDIHCIKPYSKTKWFLEQIVNKLNPSTI